MGGRRLILSGKELKLEDAFGIVTAFAEQSRLLLDHIDQISRIFGHELNIPGWSRALVGATDLATGMLSYDRRPGQHYDDVDVPNALRGCGGRPLQSLYGQDCPMAAEDHYHNHPMMIGIRARLASSPNK